MLCHLSVGLELVPMLAHAVVLCTVELCLQCRGGTDLSLFAFRGKWKTDHFACDKTRLYVGSHVVEVPILIMGADPNRH